MRQGPKEFYSSWVWRSWSPAALRPLDSCLTTPQPWTSDLQISETVNVCGLSHPVFLASLCRPQETVTLRCSELGTHG